VGMSQDLKPGLGTEEVLEIEEKCLAHKCVVAEIL